ncbi:MAG TPA: response regulator transcription factor [Deinococcales bacterium]|nr:response regulator transcription factor [Deinococcales bacterium]
MTNPVPSILIADDHPLFRVGLKHALQAQGFQVVAEAENGEQAVRLGQELHPHAALLDAKMPVMDGLEACRRLSGGNTRVIILTTFTEPGVVAAARTAGASGFVSKDASPTELAGIVLRLIADPNDSCFPPVNLPRLTTREKEVLALLPGGFSNKEIAKRLSLSPETVKDHVENVYRKLGVSDRAAAVNQAHVLGLA